MSEIKNDLWRLGSFTVDPTAAKLLHDGKPSRLSHRSFCVLVALLEASGQVVTKEELIRKGWETPHVDDSNLTHSITELRRVLAAGFGEETVIETVPRLGYRLTVPSSRNVPEPPRQFARGFPPSHFARAAGLILLTAACAGAGYFIWSRMRAVEEKQALYQEAMFQVRQRGTTSLRRATELFQKGMARFPGDGRFLGGFAETMVLQRTVNHELALETARKAVSLSPDCPQCHAVLGFILFSRHYRWEEGEQQLRAALNLDGANTQAMLWLTLLHLGRNQPAQALTQIDEAISIEPRSPNLRSAKAGVLYAMGHYQSCLNESELAQSLQPKFNLALGWTSKCHLALGQAIPFLDAVARSRAVWLEASEDWREREHMDLLQEFQRGGMEAVHKRILNYGTGKGAGLVPFDQAVSYASIGAFDAAFTLLESERDRHSRDMIFLQIVPAFKPMHAQPRWKALLASINLISPAGKSQTR
jgi:DNA-binding winged helix-turn-helix (wHTH) protein/Tfp pilus assembly protein PilF